MKIKNKFYGNIKRIHELQCYFCIQGENNMKCKNTPLILSNPSQKSPTLNLSITTPFLQLTTSAISEPTTKKNNDNNNNNNDNNNNNNNNNNNEERMAASRSDVFYRY